MSMLKQIQEMSATSSEIDTFIESIRHLANQPNGQNSQFENLYEFVNPLLFTKYDDPKIVDQFVEILKIVIKQFSNHPLKWTNDQIKTISKILTLENCNLYELYTKFHDEKEYSTDLFQNFYCELSPLESIMNTFLKSDENRKNELVKIIQNYIKYIGYPIQNSFQTKELQSFKTFLQSNQILSDFDKFSKISKTGKSKIYLLGTFPDIDDENNHVYQQLVEQCKDALTMAVVPAEKEKKDYTKYLKLDLNYFFKKISPKLEKVVFIDNEIPEDIAINTLQNADLIFLMGGLPDVQLEYLKRNSKFSEEIQQSSAVIIGRSAGAISLAKVAYCSIDEDFDSTQFLDGLNVIDLSIDPHFNCFDKEKVEENLQSSLKREIIGLPDDSCIYIDLDGNVTYFGAYYRFIENEMISCNI